MLKEFVTRLLLLVPVLIGLSIILFVIARLLPGDPVALAAGPQASQAQIEALRAEFGLDRPLLQQYFSYVGSLLQGDLGRSVMTRRPVADDIMTFLPATLELVLAALVLATVLGVPLGMVAAVYKSGWADQVIRFFSLTSLSAPPFFLGLMLQIFVAIWLDLLPLGGRFPFIVMPPDRITGLLIVDSMIAGDWQALRHALVHIALPAITLSISPMATIIGLTRASTIEVLQQDYIRTARALGLPRTKLYAKYVLKNAFGATLTLIGLYFGWLLGGTVVVETVFDWPGLGLYATRAIISQDFLPVMGVALVVGILFMLSNLVIDMCQRLLNPRTREQ